MCITAKVKMDLGRTMYDGVFIYRHTQEALSPFDVFAMLERVVQSMYIHMCVYHSHSQNGLGSNYV